MTIRKRENSNGVGIYWFVNRIWIGNWNISTNLIAEIDYQISFFQRSRYIPYRLLDDIITQAHEMGVLVAAKDEMQHLPEEEMKLFPAVDKMLEMFEKVNEIRLDYNNKK
jgi:hypothetical protein